MVYDERLAQRLGEILAGEPGVARRKMFGGLAFLVRGNMCCGIIGEDLMVRVGAERYAEALAQPHARPMDFSHRPMKGMVFVGPEGCRSDEDLKRWVKRGLDFVLTLPPK